MKVPELFIEILERLGREHGKPLPKKILKLGDKNNGWDISFNPSDEAIGGIEPFTANIKWNGFPAGIIDPGGGVIAAGSLANEEAFSEWLKSDEK